MRLAIALTLFVSGLIFAGGSIAAVASILRGGGLRGIPALIAYFGMAFACMGEAGWLLSGRAF